MRTATHPNPLSLSSSPRTSGETSVSCQTNAPAVAHDIGREAGGSGEGADEGGDVSGGGWVSGGAASRDSPPQPAGAAREAATRAPATSRRTMPHVRLPLPARL